MSKDMNGKVVVVTGGGRGLGRDFALHLASMGAAVVVNDIGAAIDGTGYHAAVAHDVVNEIGLAGGTAIAHTDSISEWQAAHALVELAVDTFGRIDGVVNNAGNMRDAHFSSMTEADWRSVIDVHLHGSFFVARAAADVFRKQRSGAYVHMTSTSALIGNREQANYIAAKMGIVGLSRAIALDMHEHNVRSNCIAPFAWTRLAQSLPATTSEQKARLERMAAAPSASVAPLATYLLSDRCTVNGQIFALRANEVFLLSQSRPVRGLHRGDGWDIDSIHEQLVPAMAHAFHPLDKTNDIFTWPPM